MNDPIDSRTRPLNLGHPPCSAFVRLRLAQANLPQPYTTRVHRNSIGQITEQLAKSGCYVAVLERLTEHAFLAMIPGPGELDADRWLMDELPEMPNYLTLPFDAPLEGDYLFFHEETGLSSCRDYVLLGTACVECQSIEDCVDNMCWECTNRAEALQQQIKELEFLKGLEVMVSALPPSSHREIAELIVDERAKFDARVRVAEMTDSQLVDYIHDIIHPTVDPLTQFDNVPEVVQLLTPDVLDNSYDAPRH